MARSEKNQAKDWEAIRAKNARLSLRKQVEVVRSSTDMAEAPLPLHKSVYTSEARFEAETQHIFHGQPLLACLSGCLLYTSPSPRDATLSRMPSSA